MAKIDGGLAWIFGLFALFTVSPAGVLILVVALSISIYTATKTREKRDKEVVQAASQSKTPNEPRPPSATERLEELARLKDQGATTEEEYETRCSRRSLRRQGLSLHQPPLPGSRPSIPRSFRECEDLICLVALEGSVEGSVDGEFESWWSGIRDCERGSGEE